MQSLFRKEAIQAKTQNTEAGIILSAGRTIDWIISLVIIITISIIALSFVINYPRMIVAHGELKTTQGKVRLYLNKAALIDEVLVANDSKVVKGQPLVWLSPAPEQEQRNRDRQAQIQQNLAQIKQQKLRLTSDQKILIKHIKQQRSLLQTELHLLNQTVSKQQQVLDFKSKQKRVLTRLVEQGSATSRQLALISEQHLDDELQLLQYQREIQLKHSQDTNALEQLSKSESQYHKQLDALQHQQATLRLELAQLQANLRYPLLATTDGIVTNLQVKPGQLLVHQLPLLQILPDEYTLYAELKLASHQIGFLTKGMSVNLQLDAFPYQQYGTVSGTIEHIAKSSLSLSEIQNTAHLPSTIYLIRVALSQQYLLHHKNQLPFIEGMNITAQIQIESRKIVDWIIGPLKGMTI